MRAVVQRVKQSSVKTDGEVVGRIGQGLLVLLGVAKGDGAEDVDFMAKKIINLRIFEDEDAPPLSQQPNPKKPPNSTKNL